MDRLDGFDLKLRKFFFSLFSLSFGFHSKLKRMAKRQGPSLCFLDLGHIVLICHVAEQSEQVNLSRLLEHFLRIAKLQRKSIATHPCQSKIRGAIFVVTNLLGRLH